MSKLRTMTIRHKLILIIMLTCFAALLLAGAALIVWEWTGLRFTMVRNLSIQAEMMADNCKAALVFEDVKDAEETLKALHVEPSIVFAEVQTASGEHFAGYYRYDVDKSIHPSEFQQEGYVFGDGYLTVFKPIVLDGQKIGTVCLRSDMGPMYAMLKRNIGTIIAMLLLSSLAALMMSSRLQKVISGPILSLAEGAARIGKGELSHRVKIRSKDELGHLAASFNDMAHRLKESYAHLEKKVQERTVELTEEVAERKQAEEQLRENEEKYKSLFEYSGDASFIMSVSEEGVRFEDCNNSTLPLFGCTERHQILGKRPEDFSPPRQPDGQTSTEKARQLTIATMAGNPQIFEWEHRRLDGTHFFVEVTLSRIDFKGQALMQAVVRDITERKKAEKALKQSEIRFKTIFENSGGAIFIANTQTGQIEECNLQAEELVGRPRSEIIGMHQSELHPNAEADEYKKLFMDSIENKKVTNIEAEVQHKDGRRIPVWISAQTVKIGEENLIVSLFMDVSERKRAEEEKTTLEGQLRQTQKMEAIGTLAGGIAHDFNNILAAMVGYADLALEDAREGTVAQNNLQQVLMAGSRAKELVRQILTFSRKTEQEQEPMEIAPIVKEALKMLRASIPTTIEISQNIQADSSVIMANSTAVHQILVNLCTNAAHAMGENGGLLEVSLTDVVIESAIATDFGTLQEGSYLKLSVKDTGCGMDREVMGRIFEPFFTTKDVDKGTGMGLSMVHGIIESYGGLITVDSEPGKGTTFNVFFPRIESSITQLSEPSEIVLGQGEMILLVDDEEPIVDMMTQMLERLGYTVVGKTDSIDALKTFRAEPDKFDLVITDYAMPNITGKQLAKELMSIRPDILIILCTGFNDDIDAEGAKSIGVKEFIMKPIDRKNIAVIIRNILDKKEIRV